jgi:hypothetical protein
MMGLIKTEVDGIYRDIETNALINRDNESLIAYKKIKKKNAEIKNLREEVDALKCDITEIKTLLTTIAEKL